MITRWIFNSQNQTIKLFDEENAFCGFFSGQKAVEIVKKLNNYE